jgi:hypothetical protein
VNSARLSIVLAVLLLALTGHGWVARYNGPAGEPDCATAIAADPAGNLYVTGSSISASGGPDFLTIKYNPFGDTLWVRRLSSAGSAADRAAAVAYASYGSAYVAGFVTVGGNTDFLTVRYRAGTGDTAWTRRYGSTGEDFAIALVADDRGSVFVGGTARFGIRSNAAVVCYDSTGVQRWATRIPARTGDSASAVTALAAAPDRGVYACGWMRAGSTVTDYFVARLRPTGETAWVRTYSGAPAGYDSAYGLAADARGNVYVTGGSMNPTLDYDYATVKYDSLGTQLWVVS